ncbi:coiled-coil domain-containing protein 102B isoform X1 [Erinaceus europaeus]|uniref:Coiled-coil domain-containing protein 102B isoform X1 n=2 Tax=Erinaceus europaeus TaxID=9365 RepID=A0A1S2ZT31_ERIEU|nr:coiled-coil domain-containing protein 102B isoform X1 [Erinaceus europaeus]
MLFTHVSVARSWRATQRPQRVTMNLESIHRLIEETHIFQRQPSSSVKSPTTMVTTDSLETRGIWDSSMSSCRQPPYATHDISSHSHQMHDWAIGEELRLRELEEVKARAAQMEKTMRWWSDCTANWRTKWSQVRAERNTAREEGRQLRIKLEMTLKELSALRKKPNLPHRQGAFEANVTPDPKLFGFIEVPVPHAQRDQCSIDWQARQSPRECLEMMGLLSKENANGKVEVLIDPIRLHEKKKLNNPDIFKNSNSESCAIKSGQRLQSVNASLDNEVPEISDSQEHLDELQKILQKEVEMRSSLEKEIEQLKAVLSVWKQKYEELKTLKPQQSNKLSILFGQEENEMGHLSGDKKEGLKYPSSKERMVSELRTELERLQAENTLEWDKREILETEKQGLERENRRLRVQVKEMEELLNSTHRIRVNAQSVDLKTSQRELQEKKKELLDLQQAYHLLSRQLQAKAAEVTCANQWVDQNEAEVKKLRCQVERLKQELHLKENELDDFLNQIHKLQRALDEQKETNENLEMELNHLQSQ